ncbi:MAG: hypothetical protein KDA96_29095, partial [Planctomycetaceae bacterium]|nr:hypothetical protein [Planctomycetaceae bacterium]
NVTIEVLTTGQLKAQYRNSAGSTWFAITSTETIPLDEWQHVAYTVDAGSSEQRLYLNGTLVASGSNADAIFFQNNGHYIGGNVGGADKLFSGLIDDARIYTRALSADEIAALAANEAEFSDSVAITVNPVNDAPTFDAGDGLVTTLIGSDRDIANGVVIQSDGKILSAGSSFNGTDYDFALVRYNA